MRENLSLLFVGFAILFAPFDASAIEQELVSPLNPRADFYRENAVDIDSLQEKVQKSTTPPAERVSSLLQLQLRYRYASVLAAASVVTDPQLELAELAGKILSNALVMSDHPHAEHASEVSLAMQQHTLGRDALRKAVLDQRPSVRDVAVSSLAALSDKQTLELIDRGVKEGLYSPLQAVNYHGLANPDVGAEHIERYLTGANAPAQAAAVSYLGANPKYQPIIKERFLDAPTAPEAAQTAAANALARFDPQFGTYAATALRNKELPPAALESIARGYFARADNQSTQGKIAVIEEALRAYQIANPAADISNVQRQIGIMRQQ